MERVTNVFCGGGGGGGVAYTNLQSGNNNSNNNNNTNTNNTPEKPTRSVPLNNPLNAMNNKGLNNNIAIRGRITRNRTKNVPLASGGTGGYLPPTTWEQLILDDHFLGKYFLYFNATERRGLAQVIFSYQSINLIMNINNLFCFFFSC